MELYLRLVIRGNAIPAVIVTAYADDRIRRRATEANVLAVLSKPFAADELLELVRRATRRGRRRSNR
jgi:FixJ family two-component response regulator